MLLSLFRISIRLTNRSVTIDVDFHDKCQQFVFCWVLAHGPHDPQELLGGDSPAAVLANNGDKLIIVSPTSITTGPAHLND